MTQTQEVSLEKQLQELERTEKSESARLQRFLDSSAQKRAALQEQIKAQNLQQEIKRKATEKDQALIQSKRIAGEINELLSQAEAKLDELYKAMQTLGSSKVSLLIPKPSSGDWPLFLESQDLRLVVSTRRMKHPAMRVLEVGNE